MTTNRMLRALGYTTSPSGISDFQRDYNKIGTRPLVVTGELDADTVEAVALAHASREVFEAVRGKLGGRHA